MTLSIHTFSYAMLLIFTVVPLHEHALAAEDKVGAKEQNSATAATSNKFNLKDQPNSFLELLPTLIESQESQNARIGPMPRPDDMEIPRPPMVREYSLEDIKDVGDVGLKQRFSRDFELAKINDPAYQAALYEFQVGDINADIAALAYTPRLSIQNRFLENENNSRTTISITQPLFNVQLLATVGEEDSRRVSAQAQMRIRENELSERVFESIIRLIESQEKLDVNTARITALQNTFMGAKRELELGVGTRTDVRDSETRLEQAGAEQIKFQSEIRTASRRLLQLTGENPDPANYGLSRVERILSVKPIETYMARALEFNSSLLKSRAEERLVELAALKSKGAYLPSVDLIASRSYSDIGSLRNSGLTFGVSVPISAATFYEASAATAQLSQARLTTREVQEQVELEIELAHSNVIAGIEEIRARFRAIESAKLSVNANEKSFSGGIRTRLDVLNSVETLYVVNQQYIQSVIELARNYLKLHNQAALPVRDTVTEIHQILF